jgi:hypothetical protein
MRRAGCEAWKRGLGRSHAAATGANLNGMLGGRASPAAEAAVSSDPPAGTPSQRPESESADGLSVTG